MFCNIAKSQRFVRKVPWSVLLMVAHNVIQATLAQTAVNVTPAITELQTELAKVSFNT